VLRLLDARTGRYAEVRPTRLGLLRVCAQVPGASGGPDLAGLRIPLVADLLARTAELRDLQVLTALASGGRDTAPWAVFERAADALNIHPPAVRTGPGEARSSLGGPVDVHLVSHDAEVDDDVSGIVVRVGPVADALGESVAGALAESVTGSLDQSAAADGRDPLAVRLALLAFPYHRPADLTEGTLADAGQRLGHWRRRVAEWAESPSRPAPARTTDQVRAAFDELDTASVLTALRDLEPDAAVPAGAKFEAFAYADRILGLDLVRDIGRVG
jgi:hypothetical protein